MSKAGALKKLYGYLTNEIARGALPKSRQKYFDEFAPDIYYHSTIQDIDKFNPQMPMDMGAYGLDSVSQPKATRGATYFTSDRELADQVLLDKNTLERSGGTSIPNLVVTEDGFSRHYLAGSRIYPVKIKTDKVFDFEDTNDLQKLENKILAKYSDESEEYELFGGIEVGDWSILEDPQMQNELKELGFRGYYTNEPGTIGLFYPDEGDVRGLYAKFDPKKQKKGEILATVAPYASVGTIGALAGLEEST